jgi:hypothetical protein
MKSHSVKSTLKRVKHTVGSLMQHMQECKGTLAMNAKREDEDKEEATTKDNKEPSSNENKFLTLPFVVDLLTQEDHGSDQDSIQSPSKEGSTATIIVGIGEWAMSRPNQWTHVFQACSTEGGADFYVDRHELGEVAASLLRDLTLQETATGKSN